jgi:hypothetical protein
MIATANQFEIAIRHAGEEVMILMAMPTGQEPRMNC